MNQKDFPSIRGWHLLIFIAFCPTVGVLLGLLIRPYLAQAGFLAMLGFFFVIGLAGVAIAVAPLGRGALPALGFHRVGWKPVVLGVLGTLALSVAVSQTGLEPEGMKQAMKVSREPAQFAAALLVMALLAPLVEELVFRGLLYGWVENRWNPTAAVIVSSLAFAAAHYEPAHIILVLPLGLLFGYLRRHTGSIVPSLVAHMMNNGFAVIAAAFLRTS